MWTEDAFVARRGRKCTPWRLIWYLLRPQIEIWSNSSITISRDILNTILSITSETFIFHVNEEEFPVTPSCVFAQGKPPWKPNGEPMVEDCSAIECSPTSLFIQQNFLLGKFSFSIIIIFLIFFLFSARSPTPRATHRRRSPFRPLNRSRAHSRSRSRSRDRESRSRRRNHARIWTPSRSRSRSLSSQDSRIGGDSPIQNGSGEMACRNGRKGHESPHDDWVYFFLCLFFSCYSTFFLVLFKIFVSLYYLFLNFTL